MEIKITKKKKMDFVTRTQILLNLLRNLKDDEVASYTADKVELHNDRSLLTRLGKRYKLGYGTKYDHDKKILQVWKEEYVEPDKNKDKYEQPVVVDIDPRIKTLKVGKSFPMPKTTPRSADVYRIRKHARSAGIKIKTFQEGKDVIIKRIS